MSYVKTINEDGTVSDIMAVALDSTLDATLLHKSELEDDLTQTTAGINALDAAQGKVLNDAMVKKADLVNGFTQTTAGVNALDAAAGKTLNDSLANKVENPLTNTISAGNSRTITLDFSDRDTYLLFIGAGYYDSSASALHGIYIVRNGAVAGIMHASSMTISISNANLTIQHTGSSSTVRYVII